MVCTRQENFFCSGGSRIRAICLILSNLAYNSFKGIDRGGSCSRLFLVFFFLAVVWLAIWLVIGYIWIKPKSKKSCFDFVMDTTLFYLKHDSNMTWNSLISLNLFYKNYIYTNI